MNKKIRPLCLLLMGTVIVTCAGCRHKPAYSDIDTNKPSRGQNANSGGEASTAQPPAAELPAPAPTQPAPAPQTPIYKVPSFMDPVSGQIRDLPSYPRAHRVNVQIGPVQGANVVTLLLQTGDPIDRITAFYEQVIKKNQWTVVDKTIDPELAEWTLKKGEDNGARVQVKKEPQTNRTTIAIVRGEKLEESNK